MSNGPTIKITAEDLDRVSPLAQSPAATGTAPAAGRSYGNINDQLSESSSASAAQEQKKRNVLLEGWFYLGAAGLLGAIAAWGICEPHFVDGGSQRWGNIWLLPAIVTLMCVGFGVSESIVERSAKKAVFRTLIALPLGVLFGFVFDVFANLIYNIGLGIAYELGVKNTHNPVWWIVRGIAWAVFGAAGGAVYGIVGQSGKKAKYGILGGMIGAGIGGLVFDPISFPFSTGALSRAVGFSIFGAATGAAMGIVESALKNRWLYVSGGPLAGKQFILYKPLTRVGSDQNCDIYLFKDKSILPDHAVLEARGSKVQLRASGTVYVAGQPTQMRVLQDDDLIQIGRYSFRYKEKQRA